MKIEIHQMDADGNPLAIMDVEPGQRFVVRAPASAIKDLASQTLHCLTALGAAEVEFISTDEPLALSTGSAIEPT